MKKALGIIAAVAVASTAIALAATVTSAKAKRVNDFTLFDTTNPAEIGAQCQGPRTFAINGAVRAFADPATMRVTFTDDDFVDYTLGGDESFSFSQAAGSNDFDSSIRVTALTGDLVGWLSASGVAVTCSPIPAP